MKIIINYDASWRNSFLDGSNNESLPKGGREFIASMTSLKEANNFIKREITQDTVMGVLNRLIGDQRKLYQARNAGYYYFKDLEPEISFIDRPSIISNEIIYIRNIKGSTDQNSFSGIIKSNDPMFNSDYSSALWGILQLNLEELLDFIIQPDAPVNSTMTFDPLLVCAYFEEIAGLKPLDINDQIQKVLDIFKTIFPDMSYLTPKNQIYPQSLYCSALYIQVMRLSQIYDLKNALTKIGGISGVSKKNFTKKDFMKRYTSGSGKIIFGNPFIKKERIKGEGEVSSILTKASGILEIKLDISRERAEELKLMIENAGVSSFYLGKKGLAYVADIDVRG